MMDNMMQEVKLECAKEIRDTIVCLCKEHCESLDQHTLFKISSYLGLFATDLRSALNYAYKNYLKNRLSPLVDKSTKQVDKVILVALIKRSDFPSCVNKNDEAIKALSNTNINPGRLLHLTKEYDPPAHALFEKLLTEESWQWLLALSSNIDKHETLIERKIQSYDPLGTTHNPAFDYIAAHHRPYYDPTSHFCYSTKYVLYSFRFIIIDENLQKPEDSNILQFVEQTPSKVKKFIDDLRNLSRNVDIYDV